MTRSLKGKKIVIFGGLLFLLALRLPATEVGGIPHQGKAIPPTILRTDKVIFPGNPQGGDTIASKSLRHTLDSLRSTVGRQPADSLKSTGAPKKGASPTLAGDTLRYDTLKASGKVQNPDSAITSGMMLNPGSLTPDGDTLRNDTLKASGKVVKPKTSAEAAEIHSPRKASIYSAMLPGLGQAYNKKYWKIPIIYGGFGALGYFIGWNNKNYKQANRAYSDLTDEDPATESFMKLKQIIYYDLTKASDVASLKQGLLSSQDYFRRNRDLLIILTAAFYGLNIIDASVDAHFFNFDISDDLTLNWEPVLRHSMDQNIFCVNCTFRF